MPEAHNIDSKDAIGRIVELIRTRLEQAVLDGQRVRLHAREGGTPRPWGQPRTEEEQRTGSDTDGSFEIHLYISARQPVRLTPSEKKDVDIVVRRRP